VSPARLHRRTPVLAVVLAASVLAAGACGDDDSGGGDAGPPLDAAAEQGRQVAQDKGCTSCHTDDGDRGTGPTWLGIWGSTVELDGDRTAVVDREYLERSVQDPRADVVDGFQPLMPSYDLTGAELDALAAYLEALAGP
jgi:cytochrome c oxidase subunit II